MADLTPNYSLELQCLELEQAQLNLNVQSQTYRIAQLADESKRIQVNIEATQTSMVALAEKINSLKGSK